MSLQSEVVAALGSWISLLGTVVRNNPNGDVYDMLARPDLSGLLSGDLATAEALVMAAFEVAWPPSDPTPYRASLEGDIQRAYAEAPAVLRAAAIAAYQSVPPVPFVRGQHPPGTNPNMEAAIKRAAAVEKAVTAAAAYLAFRNQMTVDVAAVRYRTEHVIHDGNDGWLKKWVCRKDAAGQPDARVCDWCRMLDAMGPIPIGEEFPAGDMVGNRRPPRVYFDLLGPPRHPRCRCRIILVRAGASGSVFSPAPVQLISADSVRHMSPDRYGALRDFHRAALHELGQVLRKHHQEVGAG